MDEIARVGIDLAKKVFHVTALDAAGAVMDRKGELVEAGGIEPPSEGFPPEVTTCLVAV